MNENVPSMRRASGAMALTFIVFLLSGAVSAQERTERRQMSMAERPYAECENFLVFETGYKTAISGSGLRRGKAAWALTADLGIMHNLNERHAVGLSFYGAADDDGSRTGIRARYRYWSTKRGGLDLGAGVILPSDKPSRGSPKSGFFLSGAITRAGIISIDAQLEVLKLTTSTYDTQAHRVKLSNKTETTLYLGAKSHGALAVVTTFAVLLVVSATTPSFSGF